MIIESPEQLDAVDFSKGGGLIPVIAQHADSGEVRMLGFADHAALAASLSRRELHFFSRSRRAVWRKGETSGNTLRLLALHLDCDADAALALVLPAGPTCHTGAATCFGAAPALGQLAAIIQERALQLERGAGAPDSYTARLLADRNLRLKKLTEEAGELAVACADGDPERAAEEAADLLFHTLVACRAAGVGLDDILATLRARRR